MERIINRFRIIIAAAIVLAMISGLTAAPVFASAPKTESVKYLGKGKVEVEVRQDVQYKKTKVTVKDSAGNAYKVSVYDRDDDELKFRIKNYAQGETYKFTISGVRKEHTSKYGKVTGTVKIPKEQSQEKNITAKEARNIALKDAGLTMDDIYDLEVERDRDDGVVKYEVSFKTEEWEYDYDISLKGAILHKDVEPNDDYYDDDDYYYDDDYGYDDEYYGEYSSGYAL